MPKFRKKPVVIEAMQWDGSNTFAVTTFIEGKEPDLKHPMARDAWFDYVENTRDSGFLRIFTLEDGPGGEAKHVASPGDWIIKGVQGEFYPCKPDIFAATYDPVDD
jgi:hypothetical protein